MGSSDSGSARPVGVISSSPALVQDYLDFMLQEATLEDTPHSSESLVAETVVEAVPDPVQQEAPAVNQEQCGENAAERETEGEASEAKLARPEQPARRLPDRKAAATLSDERPSAEAESGSVAPESELPDPPAAGALKSPHSDTVLPELHEHALPELDWSTPGEPETHGQRPEWAQQEFACLIFDVAGLPLAAPLLKLGGIAKLDDTLRPIAAQADWFMGLLRWNGRNIRVVDTARLLMPERVEQTDQGQEEDIPGPQRTYDCVIMLGDTGWGLAADSTVESVNLQVEDVRWRQLAGKRPWQLGTVIKHMCTLLDVNALARKLCEAEEPRRT